MAHRFAIPLSLILAIASTSVASADPPPAATSQPTSKAFEDAKASLAAGRYKEACARFVELAAADPQDLAAVHGAAVASIYLQDNKTAVGYFERAFKLQASPDRTLSYNAAVAFLNVGDPRRAATTLRDYLYATPQTPDEPLFDALGVALQQLGGREVQSKIADDQRKFYVAYRATVESKRPGMRKWGTTWLPAADVEAKERAANDAEVTLERCARQFNEAKSKLAADRQELQGTRQNTSNRTFKDATKHVNDSEKDVALCQTRYNDALVAAKAARAPFPEILFPIGIDPTVAPAIVADVPPAQAASTPPQTGTSAVATPPSGASSAVTSTPLPTTVMPTAGIPATAGGKPAFDAGQLQQCHVDADGAITVDREVRLAFAGTDRRDFVVSGEAFLGGNDEAGGMLFCLREQSGLKRYEVSGNGVRAKRVLLEGAEVPKFANPVSLSAARGRWLSFRIECRAAKLVITFDGGTGTANGPLSLDGSNGVLLRPGGRLRNVTLEVVGG